ncbi:ubiquitin-related domain-containing protein [Coprinopsis sp. MPI-PUGE-AT-0042]|nr:ubiquitin-related domain-containing protein [Coprinopsis sp. MPI-PUGE-AT-0042]
MALPSLLVEYNSQHFRLARRETYHDLIKAIRFHFPGIQADDTIQLQTNDLSTCNGQWVDISGPIWPFVQSSLQRVRLTVDPAMQESEGSPEMLTIPAGLQDNGQAIATPQIRTGFQVFVKTFRTIVTFGVEPTETVDNLRQRIHQKEGMPLDQVRMICFGRLLEDGRTLSSYNVQKESIIHLVLRLRGGKPVIYVCPPAGRTVEAAVCLSLVPEWEFSATFPVVPAKAGPTGGQTVAWTVTTLPDGNLRETQTGMDVSYL